MWKARSVCVCVLRSRDARYVPQHYHLVPVCSPKLLFCADPTLEALGLLNTAFLPHWLSVSFSVRPLGQSDMSVRNPHRSGLLCWGLSVLLIQSISSHPGKWTYTHFILNFIWSWQFREKKRKKKKVAELGLSIYFDSRKYDWRILEIEILPSHL